MPESPAVRRLLKEPRDRLGVAALAKDTGTCRLGAALPSCTAEAFHRKAAEHIPGGLRPALLPLVEAVGELTARIAAAGREVEALCEAHPETRALRQVTGGGADHRTHVRADDRGPGALPAEP